MSKVGESEGWVCHVERQKDPQGPGERRGRRRKDKSSVLGLIWGPEVVVRDGEVGICHLRTLSCPAKTALLVTGINTPEFLRWLTRAFKQNLAVTFLTT